MTGTESQLEEQRAWVRAVLAHTGLNLTQLARKIGRSPTTLTRPINNPDNDTMISSRVLAEIAEFAGLRVMEFPGRQKGFAENEAMPYRVDDRNDLSPSEKAVHDLCDGRPGRDAWIIQSGILDLEGVLPGDVLIVDTGVRPTPGDIVCAQIYDWAAGRAETAFRIYDPPFLVSRSKGLVTKPLMVDDENVKIMGVVDASVRLRKPSLEAA